MVTSLSTIRVAALAATVALAGTAPAAAAPPFMPAAPGMRSDVVQVGDSAKIIHRGRLEKDGGSWKKRRHFRERQHDRRHEARDFDGRSRLYRPKATPKFAYDAYGNLRIYDGDGWERDWDKRDRWDDDRWDWDKKKRKRPRIVKMNSFGVEEPSPELKDILTAVPN